MYHCITKDNICFKCGGHKGKFPLEPVTPIDDLKDEVIREHFYDPKAKAENRLLPEEEFWTIEWGTERIGKVGIIEKASKIHLCPDCLGEWWFGHRNGK